MIKSEAEAKKLCLSSFKFGEAIKMIEKYQDARPHLVYMTCHSIKYQWIGNCGDQPQKYIICRGLLKIEDYQYRLAKCQKRKRKICIHVIPKYANYMGAHITNCAYCISKYKA